MGRKAKKKPDELWDRITQACPGAKTRFDPLIVPELLAWLELNRLNYVQMYERLEQTPEQDRTAYTVGVIRHYKAAAGVCEELQTAANNKWSRHRWNEVVKEIDAAIQQQLRNAGENVEQTAQPPE